jgi:mannose-6-phosphate isomerase
LFLPAGNLHAYLGGAGIEVMASSDNVLRGGLTQKRVDVAELLSVLEFSELELRALEPEPASVFEAVYRTPAEEFELSRIEIAEKLRLRDRQGPEIVLAVRGSFVLQSAGDALTLDQGSAAFVPASAPEYSLEGHGSLFRARVPKSV